MTEYECCTIPFVGTWIVPTAWPNTNSSKKNLSTKKTYPLHLRCFMFNLLFAFTWCLETEQFMLGTALLEHPAADTTSWTGSHCIRRSVIACVVWLAHDSVQSWHCVKYKANVQCTCNEYTWSVQAVVLHRDVLWLKCFLVNVKIASNTCTDLHSMQVMLMWLKCFVLSCKTS